MPKGEFIGKIAGCLMELPNCRKSKSLGTMRTIRTFSSSPLCMLFFTMCRLPNQCEAQTRATPEIYVLQFQLQKEMTWLFQSWIQNSWQGSSWSICIRCLLLDLSKCLEGWAPYMAPREYGRCRGVSIEKDAGVIVSLVSTTILIWQTKKVKL